MERVVKAHEVFECVEMLIEGEGIVSPIHDTHNYTLCCPQSGRYWRNPNPILWM